MNIDNLNYFIGTALAHQLNEFVGYSDFTDEELLKLTSLSISTMTDITGISRLKNLKNLSISFFDLLEYQYDGIINYSELNNLTTLKSLIITNNLHIKKLDLSKLENLEVLIIVSNSNLEQICGLQNLKKLQRVVIVGNNVKDLEEVQKYIINTKNTKINILDYKIFNSIYNDKDDYKFLSDIAKTYDTNLSFAEKIGIGEIFIYSFNMIDRINTKAEVILKNIIKDNMSEEEKVLSVYRYIIDNLTYDYDGLKKRADFVLRNSNKIPTYENIHKYINSSYEAFMSGKVVCEGYVNMMNFLLNKLNIESRTVYCGAKNSSSYTKGLYNHAANIIKLGEEWYYFDAQLEENSSNLKFFKKTRKEFSETHDMSPSAQVPDIKIKVK